MEQFSIDEQGRLTSTTTRDFDEKLGCKLQEQDFKNSHLKILLLSQFINQYFSLFLFYLSHFFLASVLSSVYFILCFLPKFFQLFPHFFLQPNNEEEESLYRGFSRVRNLGETSEVKDEFRIRNLKIS
uniref:Transmembrane protein n=1 Tax=Spongospora subterranea TaxID=70186 RepID=A0A0H5QGQ8_9EUKA|eukprot:CRZ00496.1 hypothetical protein [Spongospora subterranea]